jgi:hypothetical protein
MKKYMFFPILFLFATDLLAQKKTYKINLNDTRLKNKKILRIQVIGDSSKLVLVNALPTKTYNVETEETINNIDPFENIDFASIRTTASNSETPNCRILLEVAILNIQNESDERMLPKLLARLKKIKDSIACKNDQSLIDIIAQSENIIDASTKVIFNDVVNEKGQTTVKIYRDDLPDTKPWKVKLVGKKFDSWVTTFGFSFFRTKNQLYYSEQLAGTSTYKIKRSNDSANYKWDYVPTIMLTYSNTFSPSFAWGISGGLGYDLKKPSVLLGGSIIYKSNLLLTIGTVMHERQVLNGKYTPEQIVPAALDEAALHTGRYRLNLFFTLSFKFASSPFK